MYRIEWGWSRLGGYDVTTRGDKRFSPLVAKMPDGRSIEAWYQCDIKGHNPGGTNWSDYKGKPSLVPYLPGQQYNMFLGLWRVWAVHHTELLVELYELTKEKRLLSDMFAHDKGLHPVNQARALAQIINEWVLPTMEPIKQGD